MTSKERIYATIHGEPRDRAPVMPILMTWAAHFIGRSYRDYYLDGDVLVDGQLAMARTFGVDQVSTISDPWREAEAYGMVLDYPDEGTGIPRAYLLQSPEDVTRLGPLDVETAPRMKQRVESVRRLATELGQTHGVLGWVEGPMAEYVDLRNMEPAMLDLVDRPETFHEAAAIMVENALTFARAQIDAGADMIGVGDAAASLVGPALYTEHVLPWEKKLFEGIHEAGAAVRVHICGNIRPIVEALASAEPEVIDVDWMVPLDETRAKVGPNVTLCGNFDPTAVLLQSTKEDVATAARGCIADAGDRFILMPGCEVPPGTAEENIRAFCPCEGCLIEEALHS